MRLLRIMPVLYRGPNSAITSDLGRIRQIARVSVRMRVQRTQFIIPTAVHWLDIWRHKQPELHLGTDYACADAGRVQWLCERQQYHDHPGDISIHGRPRIQTRHHRQYHDDRERHRRKQHYADLYDDSGVANGLHSPAVGAMLSH